MALTGDISGSMGKSSVIGITGSLDLTYDGEGTEDGWIQLREMASDPATPGTDQGKIYIKDNGSGTTTPYFLDSGGTATSLLGGGGGGGSPAGSDGQVQYNNGGSFGGASGLVYDDSNNRVGIGTSPSTTLHVLADASSAYVATIDNDASSAGHVLRLLTDGNGSGTRILEMEDGDGDVLFRARADGRFGFGPDGVSSMGAGTFVVGIDNSSHTSDIAISQRLQHLGDSDTYIDFPANDQISLEAGGITAIKLNEASYDYIKLNSSHNDVDTIISGQNQNRVLFMGVAQQNAEQVLILSGGAAGSNDTASGADVAFFVSGSVGAKDSGTKGASVFGGDLITSGTSWNMNNLVVEDIDADEQGMIVIGDTLSSAYTSITTSQYGRVTIQSRKSVRDGEIWLDSADDIVLDTEGTVEIRDTGTSVLKITPNNSDVSIQPQVSGKDLLLSSQSGNTVLTIDSSDDAMKINRRLGLSSNFLSSTGTISADEPFSMIVNMGGSAITGTLPDPTFAGQLKVIVGLQMSTGACILSYTNAGGATTTKTLGNGIGLLLCGFDGTGGGSYRWFPIGDVS